MVKYSMLISFTLIKCKAVRKSIPVLEKLLDHQV